MRFQSTINERSQIFMSSTATILSSTNFPTAIGSLASWGLNGQLCGWHLSDAATRNENLVSGFDLRLGILTQQSDESVKTHRAVRTACACGKIVVTWIAFLDIRDELKNPVCQGLAFRAQVRGDCGDASETA